MLLNAKMKDTQMQIKFQKKDKKERDAKKSDKDKKNKEDKKVVRLNYSVNFLQYQMNLI